MSDFGEITMERKESGQTGEKNLFTKLSSLSANENDEIERLRKKFNVMEVKVDEVYNYLLASETINPRKNTASKIGIAAAAILAIGTAVLAFGLAGTDNNVMAVSLGISVCGIVALFISLMLGSSKSKQKSRPR
jgi:hypothetical protein